MASRTRIIGLVDCDSFFASCEKVFRPDWRDRPVVVLSNNDGCVVARSPEAKALQIPMGEPYFKLRAFARARGVVTRSANYALYGDMSRRVIETLSTFADEIDVYSIDEAFFDLTPYFCDSTGRYPGENEEALELGELPRGTREAVEPVAEQIAATIRKWTGVPVSIGLGPTRTLAKAASRVAKDEYPRRRRKCAALFDLAEREAALANLPVEKIWGVGRRLAPNFQKCGLRTALDLARVDPNTIRRFYSINQERTVRELRGELIFDAVSRPEPQQSMQISRSFGETVASLDVLEKPVATFASKLAAKLRARKLVASALYVYVATDRFNEKAPQRSGGNAVALPRPTNATPEILSRALQVLRAIYEPGFRYKKAGVVALETLPESAAQARRYLFELDPTRSEETRERDRNVSATLDRVNSKFGAGSIFFASEGVERAWRPNSNFVSPQYTTDWEALPRAS